MRYANLELGRTKMPPAIRHQSDSGSGRGCGREFDVENTPGVPAMT
jgi:hypothetical protein